MTPFEIETALSAAGIPSPKCRLDDNKGRYRVTAETEINGRHESHSEIVHLWVTPKELEPVVEKFRLWYSDLSENKAPD